MPTSRRDFLYALAGGPLILAVDTLPGGYARTRQSNIAPPRVTNYRVDKRALLVEGQTLLVAFTFPDSIEQLTGSLPVRIKSASPSNESNNEPLIEPQPLSLSIRRQAHVPRDSLRAARLHRRPRRAALVRLAANAAKHIHMDISLCGAAGVYRQSSLTLDKTSASLRRKLRAVCALILKRWLKSTVVAPRVAGKRNSWSLFRELTETTSAITVSLMEQSITAMPDWIIARRQVRLCAQSTMASSLCPASSGRPARPFA
jgi:hypothetical protein